MTELIKVRFKLKDEEEYSDWISATFIEEYKGGKCLARVHDSGLEQTFDKNGWM